MANVAEDGNVAGSDAVMVISVWTDAPAGFLGRLSSTSDRGETSVETVTSPDELLAVVQRWVASLG